MSCRLCFRELQLFIYVFDKHGQDNYGIAAVVAKCLSVKLTPSSADRDKVCLQCWSILRKFHRFCQEIEEKQSELELSLITTKDVDDEFDVSEIMETQVPGIEAQVPDEIINVNSEYFEIENQKTSKSTTDIPDTGIELTEHTTDIPDTGIELTEHTTDIPDTGIELTQHTTDIPDTGIELAEHTTDIPDTGIELTQHTTDIPDTGIELAEHTTDIPDTGIELTVSTPSSAILIRKVGRPGKKDVTSSMNDDRVIARHIQLKCDECQAEERTFNDLKVHFRQMHGRDGYVVCCGKRIFHKGLLLEHIYRHGNQSHFKCIECSQVFASSICLRNHNLRKHPKEGDLPFACQQCPKRYTNYNYLQRHALSHANGEVEKFQCELCKTSYQTESDLESHRRSEHRHAALNICNHCGEQIRGSSAFRLHLEKHEGVVDPALQCKICQSTLSPQSASEAHRRYHHLLNNHKCSICNKAFRTSQSLKEHIATHTGEIL